MQSPRKQMSKDAKLLPKKVQLELKSSDHDEDETCDAFYVSVPSVFSAIKLIDSVNNTLYTYTILLIILCPGSIILKLGSGQFAVLNSQQHKDDHVNIMTNAEKFRGADVVKKKTATLHYTFIDSSFRVFF